MRYYAINEWRRGRTPQTCLSVLNVTISTTDLVVVVMGVGFGVAW